MNMHKYKAVIQPLMRLGITEHDAMALRRVAMTLHRWHELECGVDGGAIERDETGRTWFYHYGTAVTSARRWSVADRETGALKRLDAIMANYPELVHYVQGDPRGASLYVLRRDTIGVTEKLDSVYSRGVAIYK